MVRGMMLLCPLDDDFGLYLLLVFHVSPLFRGAQAIEDF